MKIKDPIKFIEYYVGIFKAMESSGGTFFPECKTPQQKAEAVLKLGYWDVKIVNLRMATHFMQLGCLNVGICPVCGDSPIGRDESWPFSWGWNFGPTLYLCKECYEIGAQKEFEHKQNRKKGCFIATACYVENNSPELIALRSYRDNFLNRKYWGRMFVKTYYLVSPPIAKKLKKNELLRKGVKRYILDPIAKKIMRIKR